MNTVERAAEKSLKMLCEPPPRPPRVPVSAEVRLIRDHVEASEAELHRVRVLAMERKKPMPQYPATREQMKALLEKLGSR